ncbi:NACHT, LRR and PYD domains-containing protein 3-like [Cololabis saira]|uniref:NACHT, LRR and PYD domains-containing protein 3-like n=1 Tax=Cololabis saira TaxID=129043 RepID=UPI002AD48A1B|nr:NACHT, LRR and PYD domains-containing protein 3-like [Cololabis saira]
MWKWKWNWKRKDETVPPEQKRGQGAQSIQPQTHDDVTSEDQDDSREVMTSRSDSYTVKMWLKDTLKNLDSSGLKEFQWYLNNAEESKDGFKPIELCYLENADRLDTVNLMMQRFSSKTREVAETILKKLKEKPDVQDDPVSPAGATGTVVEVCKKLKSKLQKKYQCVSEGVTKAGKKTLLEQIYTELYITEGGTGEVNKEHEVRQIEAASRKPDGAETTIRQEDIFKPPPGRGGPIRTVMTKGVAGIWKTVLTQKFSLDWAEGRTNQDIQFLLPFTFRELNVLREEKFSLVELVHGFFSETRGICSFEEFQVVFIFDGLDESRLPLDFHNNEDLTDVTESTSVDVLLTNLIRGNLLPSARLWITTRPAAANQIPPECVDMVTEVRVFSGIPEKPDEDPEAAVHDFIRNHLKLPEDMANSITFHRVHRLGGRRSEAQRPRPIVAKFEHFKQKELVRRRGPQLRGLPFSVNDQFPREILDRRRVLFPVRRRLISEGCRAVITVDRLYVNGELYRNPNITPWLF